MHASKSGALSRLAVGFATLVVAGSAHAVDFPEVEPNDTKAASNVIVGMQPGDTISGLTTGASTTVAGDGSADNFDITTAAAPAAGIYRYRLVITTAGTAGHTGTIRGLTQTAGVVNPGTDAVIQTSSATSTPARYVQWYANETPSRIIYRVTGGAATTSTYTVTLEREAATVGDVPLPTTAGGVFVSTVGQTTSDTDLWVYDGNFNAIPLAGNDDNTVAGGGPGAGLQSYLRRELAAGTYYLAVANYNLANNQPLSPTEENGPVDPVMDYPNALATSSTAVNADNDFEIGNRCLATSQAVTNVRVGLFDVTLWRFTLTDPAAPGPNAFLAGSATPALVMPGGSTLLSVTLSGTAAAGQVTGDLSAFGLSGAEVFVDPELDNVWTYNLSIPPMQGTGVYPVVVTGPAGGCEGAPTRTINVTIPVEGDACASALPITPGTVVQGNNAAATNESPAPPSCNGLLTFNLGVWYTFTATDSHRFQASTCSLLTDFNTRVYVYSGSCGALTCVNANATATPACPDRSDAATASWCGIAGTTYYILVTNDTTGSGNFDLLVSDLGPTCPTNDGCATAATLIPGTPVSGNTSAATNETPAPPACNGFSTFNLGLWYTFTPSNGNRYQASTCSALTDFNTRVYVYTGACGALTCVNANATASPACPDRSDAATTTWCAVAGTTYYILVTNDTTGTGNFDLLVSDLGPTCVPPGNDNCASGTVITTVPFTDAPFVDAATPDIDVSCNAAANIESRGGVWYTYTPTEPGSFNFTETGPADVVFTVFTGGADCSGLAEVFCNTNETGTVPFAATAGTQYHILVSMTSNTAVIPANYALTINYIPSPGACCTGTNCTITAGAAACTGSGGVFQGYGTNCGLHSFMIEPGPPASFVSIAATGQQLATVSNCDDCGETVNLPFNFSYLGEVYSTIWVCSNGFAQFGATTNTTFGNAPIPTAGVPNNMLCPLWDDMITTAFGDVYVEAAGTTPNQTFTISWEGVEDFAVDGALQNFQIVLQENGNVKFRYGVLTPEPTAGDWTVGYEDQTGANGGSVTGASLGAGDVSLQLTAQSTSSPCDAMTGACCCGSSCSVTTSTACVGTNRAFAGAGTACTPFSFTAPCCRGNYNKSEPGPGAPGGVSVQDIFDFLTGYFTSDPCANSNDSEPGPGSPNGVSVQDIFDYLTAYFGGC